MGCHSSHWRTPSFFKMVIAQSTSWVIWLWFMFFLLQGQDGNLCRGCRLAPLCRCAGKGSSWDTCHFYWMKQLFVACICLSFCRGTPVFETYVFFEIEVRLTNDCSIAWSHREERAVEELSKRDYAQKSGEENRTAEWKRLETSIAEKRRVEEIGTESRREEEWRETEEKRCLVFALAPKNHLACSWCFGSRCFSWWFRFGISSLDLGISCVPWVRI